jgi:drug/metabolite transporter (DMT)-like permease
MESIKGRISMAAGFALAGTAVIAARFVTDILGTFTITAASLFAALVILLPFYRIRVRQAMRAMDRNDWKMIFLQALFGIFLFRAFLLFGLQHTSSTEAGILIGAAPVLTSILARAVLKERADGKAVAGIFFAVSGVLLLQGGYGSGLSPEHLLGNMLALCAAACESLFNILSRAQSIKKAAAAETTDPVVQSLLVSAIAFFFCLVPAFLEHPVNALCSLPPDGWAALLWYGLFITMLSYVLWYAGIKRCSAFTAAAFSSVMPFTSMVLSFLILREPIRGAQWLGGGLIIAGVTAIAAAQTTGKGEKQLKNNSTI